MQHKELHIMLVGDSGVGKSCLLLSYATNRKPTLGCIPKLLVGDDEEEDLTSIPIMVAGEEVDVRLVDTSESSEFERLRMTSYQKADVIAVCFSVTNPASLRHVSTKWLPEIRAAAPHLPLLLVGTKSELRKKDETMEMGKFVGLASVSQEQAQAVSKQMKAKYVECSAFEGTGVKAVFDELVKLSLTSSKKRKVKNGKRCVVM